MKQTLFKIGGAFLVVVTIFLIGRFTAPKPFIDNREKIKALIQDTVRLANQRDVALDSMRHYHIMANTYFKVSQDKQKEKIITRTIYRNETIRNRSLTVLQRDSIIRAELLH